MIHQLDYLLGHYGYFGIIIALIGGIIGLPIPDEVLLTYVGFNVFQEKMAYVPSLLSAFTGAIGGITLSYLLGVKLGSPFLHKYGPKFHISEKKIQQTKALFDKFGPFLLFIGYFIPGVRHLTAYLAGINNFSFKRFATFAYAGAILWGFTFITLGTVLGFEWDKVGIYLLRYSKYIIPLFVILSLAIAFMYWRKKKFLPIKRFTNE